MSAMATGKTRAVITCPACDEVVAVGQRDAVNCAHCGASARPWWTLTAEPSWYLFLGGVLSLGLSNYQPAFAFQSADHLKFPMTLFDGMAKLFREGEWEFAAVIFLATFVVPWFRVFALGGLLWADDFDMRTFQNERAWLLRAIRWLGRWTLLDVFTVAVLSAAASFGTELSLTVGSGLWLYCLSGVLMHGGSLAFDARRIWR